MDNDRNSNVDDIEGDVDCQGCGAKDDNGALGETWVACDRCATWHHAMCVGRWSEKQCDQAFLCRHCTLSMTRGAPRVIRSLLARKPCTPRCRPPGCSGGKGCERGMGLLLTERQQDGITKLVLDIDRANFDFLNASPAEGESVAFEHEDGLVEAIVLSSDDSSVVVRWTGADKVSYSKRTRIARIHRFGLRLSKAEAESYAKGLGVAAFIPASKQLLYEMRLARKQLQLTLPITPAGYIARRKKAERTATLFATELAGRADGDNHGAAEMQDEDEGEDEGGDE